MGKRAILRTALSLTGVVRAKWWLMAPGLYCFNYHRIGDPRGTEFDRNTFSCTAERFDDHVGFLKENFDILNLDRLLSLDGRRGGRKALGLITFDDGYADNYSLAFPVLRRHGVSAVFFLPTAFIGTARIPWWDEIAWLLRRSAGKVIALAGAEPIRVEADACDQSIRRVLKLVKTRQVPIEDQVEEIRQACGGLHTPGPDERAGLFLTWDQAREMHAAGMDIGSHTHTHRILSRLAAPDQREELATSKAILEAELKAPITSVAYPVGSRSAYTAETCNVAGSLGYRLGFNFLHGRNSFPLRSPLDVKRFAVTGNATAQGLRSSICFPRLFAA